MAGLESLEVEKSMLDVKQSVEHAAKLITNRRMPEVHEIFRAGGSTTSGAVRDSEPIHHRETA